MAAWSKEQVFVIVPSIEDKIVKFANRDAHHVFIEPEGRDNIRLYPNGTSNSLPESVQTKMIRSIRVWRMRR